MVDERWDVSKAEGLTLKQYDESVILGAQTDTEAAFLMNARRFYAKLEGLGVAPEMLSYGPSWLQLERISGVYEPRIPNAEMDFLWGCIALLRAFQQQGIVHGDLTDKNILIRDNRPLAIDFQESHFVWEPYTPKRPEPDALQLWWAAVKITRDRDRRFRRWIAMRDLIEGSVVDLGANEGHFCALCRVDSKASTVSWIDRDDRHRLDAAEHDAADFYWTVDLATMKPEPHADTVLLLSTWAYLVQEMGYSAAVDWLAVVIDHCGQLFFETQLFLDGPGPPELREDGDVERLFQSLGAQAWPLVSIDVHGRPAIRTLWRVLGHAKGTEVAPSVAADAGTSR